MSATQYYIIINGEQEGPYFKDQLQSHGLTLETPVWNEGMEDWKRASEVPELAALFEKKAVPPVMGQPLADAKLNSLSANLPPEEQYYAIIADIKMGPAPLAQLVRKGMNLDSPVWKNGMADWAPAYTIPEVAEFINQTTQPYSQPYSQPQPFQPQPMQAPQQPMAPGAPQNGYGQQPVIMGPPIRHTNWLPWAVVGTVLGLGSCITSILGIVGIVYADKANVAYNRGDKATGDAANSTAKTMTIITLIVLGISMVCAAICFFIGIFEAVNNNYY